MPEREPKPTMKDIVASEIKSQNGSNELARIKRVINNFIFRLPKSDGRSINTVIDQGLDIPLNPERRYIDECVRENEKETDIVDKLRADGWSDKRIFGTNAQFDADVKTAIEQSGIDSTAFFALMDQFIPGKVSLPSILNTAEILHQFVLPVYVKLREMGYTLRDLY